MKGITCIPFQGRVDLRNPEHKFWLIETDDFGNRKLLPTYQLKSRNYLGPTAMDAEAAFLMANQAQAMPRKTWSILVAAAHFGAMAMGADIDIRVVRDGSGPDCNVWSNFKQMSDAIICDPPYGVRAGGRKSGAECVHDLLDLATKMLVMGGYLVYFYQELRDSDTLDVNFRKHPCFKLIVGCEQMLSYRYGRVLLTMVKIAPYTDEIAEAAQPQHLDFKENHLKWLEEGNLHVAVFSPEFPLVDDGDSLSSKNYKKKYRGKYV
ncbi:DNA methylase, N-6 adenine-specific, conserved site-containing protein [Artemisia annua]|uniref:DNA methylase, N-6 adenine-specific, conserved site-containing protein n=1 Tax=Artemisia annua TaxID=35608 RepID=A0A2U1KVG9_ARTAN|nr:DNA methylase, N-6 adenine-specific, conserved site-containing protein [Artemisia annua]